MATATVELQSIYNQATDLATQASAIVIRDAQGYGSACELLRTIKSFRKQVDDAFDPIIEAAHKAHKISIAQKKRSDAPLEKAEIYLKSGVLAWDREQERIRQAQEERLRLEAREKAEEEARKAAEEAKLAAAISAEQMGDAKAAEEIMAQPTVVAPVYVPPVILPKTTPGVAGVSIRKNWKARIVNPDLVPREFCSPDEKKLNQYAKALEEKAKVPGVEFYDAGSVASRAF